MNLDMPRLLKAVTDDNFAAWLELQRYKLYFWLGPRMAILWLRIKYGWNDTREEFVN